MRLRLMGMSVSGALTALVVASPVAAQTGTGTAPSAPAEAPLLGEVIVTAQKREQRLQDVPLAIQSFDGDSLAKQGVKSAADAISQVPSASVQSSDTTNTIFQMRGMSQDAATDSTVAVYVDEIPFGFPNDPGIPAIDALDLQRIEVIRGPQGTLYGLGAMGGTVRVITSDPSFAEGLSGKFTSEGSAVDGGNPSYLVSGVLNAPLIDDVLAGRVSVTYRRVGGWVDDQPDGRNNVNLSTLSSVRVKQLFTPTEGLKIKLTYWHNSSDATWDDLSDVKNRAVKLTGVGTNPEPASSLRSNIWSGFASYDLGFATVEDGLSDYQHSRPSTFVNPFLNVYANVVDKAVTNEFRIVSNGHTAFQWVLGAFYRDATWDRSTGGVIAGFNFPPALLHVNSKSISEFSELSYGFADDLVRVLAGGRYFRDDRTSVDSNEGVVSYVYEKTFTSFNPRFNITAKPYRDLSVYFNAAKGFRSGYLNDGQQVAVAASAGVTGIQIVKPDSVWTYEIGAKTTLLDGKLFLDSALFYSNWKNFQTQATALGLSYQVNGGDARIKGVEWGATWRTPLEGLSINLNASYNEGRFTSVNPLIVTGTYYAPGARLPGVPQWAGNGSFDYDAPLGGTGLRFVAGGALTYRGNQTSGSGEPGVFVDARTELSLRAGLGWNKWELTTFANNVTNDLKSITEGAGQWTVPMPRTMGVRITGGF
jgi:iron complex outermembrane receptor protein